MTDSDQIRIARAREALEGLSVGDAFGELFIRIGSYRAAAYIQYRQTPLAMGWMWTDDTNMALSIYQELRQHGEIDQDRLAQSFAAHFEPRRGYGAGAIRLLMNIRQGAPWRQSARTMFGGQGSYGNGGAMRIAPLGAYFADDLAQCADQARLATEVTHMHPEGVAGGIAIALAAALATRLRGQPTPDRRTFLDLILPHMPDSIVREKIRHARELALDASMQLAASALGNGGQISAQDTVAYCLWCAGEQLANYEEALWLTASAGGDVDTNCAIVGGIVAAHIGMDGIPQSSRDAREPLPDWAL